MYARNTPDDIYHLLKEGDEEKTLCNLRVLPIIIDRSFDIGLLHLTSDRPTDHELCDDCARIERARILG
jgi:hypothetical protein